jgi:hypothetical protein
VFLSLLLIFVFKSSSNEWAGSSGRAVWGTQSLRPLEYWDRGFEYHSRQRCVSAFSCV